MGKANSDLAFLIKAIMEDRFDWVVQSKYLQEIDQVDQYGFNSLELAQLLGRRLFQELLEPDSFSLAFKVQLRGQSAISPLNLSEFEKQFGITFRSSLTFPSYYALEEVIRSCPYFFRLGNLLGTQSQLEREYQSQLFHSTFADSYVKWIDPTMGYGLFAAVDLPANTFIGEYTGVVRHMDRTAPLFNPYCFHYPTRFWSNQYYVIDAKEEGNLSRFINHSARPNLQPLWLLNRGVLHLVFIANQSIQAGTELTFNYGSDYWIRRRAICQHEVKF